MTGEPHKTLGKYQILGQLGKGAMGVVYRGFDPILEREVALKVMASAIVSDDDLKERFESEAKNVAKLQHPNIVTVYDLGYDEEGAPFIAMELLKGQDLEHRIRRDPLSLREKLQVMEQVCRGLAVAHKNGIVHRDIKPANIFITETGAAKIMDFGVARWQQSSRTQTGAVLGTADYMSPEQIKGARVDGRSDIFSVGVILYRLLTNKKPFSGENIQSVFFKVLNEEPPAIVLPEGNEMPELTAIVGKALSKSLEHRYAESNDLADDIRDLMNHYQEVLQENTVFETIFEHPTTADAEMGSDAPSRRTSGSDRIFSSAGTGSISRTHRPESAYPARTARPPQPTADTGASAPTVSGPGTSSGTGTGAGVGATRMGGTPQESPSLAPTQLEAPARRPRAAAATSGTRRGAAVGIPIEPSAPYGKIAAGVALVAVLAGGGYWLMSGSSNSSTGVESTSSTSTSGVEERFARAEDAVAKGLYSLASNEVEEILLSDPSNARALELQARINEALTEQRGESRTSTDRADAGSTGAGAPASADPKPSRTSASNPSTSDSANPNVARSAELAADASLAIADGQLATAEQLIREGRALDPGNSRWGQLSQQLARSREAAEQSRRSAARQATVDSYVAQAAQHIQNEDYEAAIAAYDLALAEDPANAQVIALKTSAMTASQLEQRQAAPASPTLRFTESKTEYQAAGGNDAPRGFAGGGVKVKRATNAAANPLELLIQINPDTVRPGQPYVIRVRATNQGNRPIGIKTLELVSTYGSRTTGKGQALSPMVGQINPRETSLIFEINGTWTEQQNRGRLEAVVTLVGDATVRKTLEWQ